ncbi:MAG TPA: metallophosphoesterase [Candidatus Dormibacteraeota bacterium]|nr:metallophosphoesterase [Candidatus Dormibacteraeota bacterium]
MLTTERRLGAGPILRAGSSAPYRSVVEQPGEPHLVRAELVAKPPADEVVAHGRAIACIGHITDLHVTDVQSPARFEFVNREWEDPRFRELLTMQRPHEALNARAVEALLRTFHSIDRAPVTGSAIELVAMTGDSIDNTQLNELTNFLALMDGGAVRPDSGVPGYDGVQAAQWPSDIFWKPDGPVGGDLFQKGLGYPRVPGLLELAMEPFQAAGLGLPWLGCYGNHEEVCQGVGVVNLTLAPAMVGSRKPLALPEGLDRDHALETFVRSPDYFMSGRALEVAPDAARRPITRPEFVELHHQSGRHGFTEANRADGTAYYVHDTPRVRFITLDTVCPAGGADGQVDPAQLHWLERRLEEVHSTFPTRDRSVLRTQNQDRMVVLLSHHGFDTLSNPRGLQGGAELLELLHRFHNVVLWLNGHIHANRITPRPGGVGGGFWEVTTSALVDWPCQGRMVELFEAGSGLLGIACTMVDHDGEGLAGVHRELAANVPFSGFDSWRPGRPEDRNVVLLLAAPF